MILTFHVCTADKTASLPSFFVVVFSSLIYRARNVDITHFKSPKSSTGCGQCREALGKGPVLSRIVKFERIPNIYGF